MNNISCAINGYIEPSLEKTPSKEVRLLSSCEQVELEPELDVEHLVYSCLDQYIENNQGVKPTHIFLHPTLLKLLLNQISSQCDTTSSFRGIQHIQFQYNNLLILVCMTSINDKKDLILVGDKSAYNDYIMERDILGDHH